MKPKRTDFFLEEPASIPQCLLTDLTPKLLKVCNFFSEPTNQQLNKINKLVASNEELKPVRVADNTQAFMFETHMMLNCTPWGLEKCGKIQPDYYKAWQDLKSHFDPKAVPQ